MAAAVSVPPFCNSAPMRWSSTYDCHDILPSVAWYRGEGSLCKPDQRPPRADPPSEQRVHSKVSLRGVVNAVWLCRVRVRTDHQGLEKRQRRASSLRT